MAIIAITNLNTATLESAFGPVLPGATKVFSGITTTALDAALAALNTGVDANELNYSTLVDPAGQGAASDVQNKLGKLTVRSLVAESQTISGDIVVDDITCDDIAADAIAAATVAATGAITGASAAVTGALTSATVAATGAITGASATATGAVQGATVVATTSSTLKAATADTVTLIGTAPAKNDSSNNVVTKANFIGAWGKVTTDGAGAVALVDGFNVTSVALGGGNTSILVTLGTDFAAADYSVVVTPLGAALVGGIGAKAAGTFNAILGDVSGVAGSVAVTFNNTVTEFDFICVGRQ